MVVISLTTIPPRIPYLHITIRSLLDQTIPCRIIVNIPIRYNNFTNQFTIPEWLNHPNIIVNRCKDYGPATKLLGLETQSLDPHERIIVVDDDRVYSNTLAEQFVSAGKIYPNYALTICGWDIETLSGNLLTYPKKGTRGIEFIKEGFIDILGGCGGFSLTVCQIPNIREMYKIDNVDRKYYVDDVVFSGFLTVTNTPIYMLVGRDPTRHKNDSIDSLCDNNTYGTRIQCNIEAIQYFIDTYGIWK